MLFICYPITNVEILKGRKYRLEIPKQTAKTLFIGHSPGTVVTQAVALRNEVGRIR